MFFLESLWVAILVAVVGSLLASMNGALKLARKDKDE